MSAKIYELKPVEQRFDFEIVPMDGERCQLIARTRLGELFLQSHGADFSRAFWTGQALEFCLKHRVSFTCPVYEFVIKDAYRVR